MIAFIREGWPLWASCIPVGVLCGFVWVSVGVVPAVVPMLLELGLLMYLFLVRGVEA